MKTISYSLIGLFLLIALVSCGTGLERLDISARKLANAFNPGAPSSDSPQQGQLLGVTGTVTETSEYPEGSQVVLAGNGFRSILCESPSPYKDDNLWTGETVFAVGKFGGLETSSENLTLTDCRIGAFGEGLAGRQAEFSSISSPLSGLGLFFGWVIIAVLGYLPPGLWRVQFMWWVVPKLAAHTAMIVLLYYFFARLVLPAYGREDASISSILIWPLIVFVNSRGG